MFWILGGLSIAMWLVVPFFFVYLFGAMQRQKGLVDPYLGTKIALALLLTLCFQVMLGATAVLLMNVLMGWDGSGSVDMLAYGVGSLTAGIFPLILYRRAASHGGYDVTRRTLGINGLLVAIMSTILIMVFFEQLFSGNDVKGMLGLMLVYVPTGYILLNRLIQRADAEGSKPGPKTDAKHEAPATA